MPPRTLFFDPEVIFVVGLVGGGLAAATYVLYQWATAQGEALPNTPLPDLPGPPVLHFDDQGMPILPNLPR